MHRGGADRKIEDEERGAERMRREGVYIYVTYICACIYVHEYMHTYIHTIYIHTIYIYIHEYLHVYV
jgi:hypothetical protein